MKRELISSRNELDNKKSTYEKQLKSSKSQISKLKDTFNNLEKRADKEYSFGLAFSYNCIMSVLKKEHAKLYMSKLEYSVNKYIEE